MEIKAQTYHFESLEYDIDNVFMRLHLSANGIMKLVQEEIYHKGIYDPKRYILPEEDNKEFESFQEILRNLNNIVYFNSLILGAYSIFEICLIRICEFIESHSCPRIKFDTPKRKILKNCRKFIHDSKLVDLTIKSFDSRYNHISDVNKLRNLITHYNGNLIKEKNKILELQADYEYCANEEYLTIMNNGQVYINDFEYINNFIVESEQFIKAIFKQLENRK